MSPLVSLLPNPSRPWYEGLDSLEAELRQIFEGSLLEELTLDSEAQILRLRLRMALVPESAAPFDALLASMRIDGTRALMEVRYPEGALTAAEYLALHFGSLRSWLEHEFGADAQAGMDYEAEEGASQTLVRLRCTSQMAAERLKRAKLDERVRQWLRAACGEDAQIVISEGAEWNIADSKDDLGARSSAPKMPLASAPAPGPAKPSESKAKAPAPAEKVLWGKPIPANMVKRMAELTQPAENVAIEGRIFDFRAEIRGRQGKMLVKMSVTDGSDSLTVTSWLEPDKPAPRELEKGKYCRVRGRLEINKWEGDQLVLSADHVMSVQRKLKRMDNAPVKRVELHAHTKMSASDGLTNIDEYIQRALDWGHSAVGISDHGVVHAFPEAWKIAGGKPIKLLLGMEAYLVPDAGFIQKLREARESKRADLLPEIPPLWHCMVYARSEAGRRHLYELVSHSHTKTFYKKPIIDRALLASKREGLVIGSACEQGELYQAIVGGASDAELEKIASFYDYLEVQPPANNAFMVRNGSASEEGLRENVRRILNLGIKLGKPVVATSDLHFLDPEDEVYRRILQAGQGFDDADQQAPLYFHTTEEMLSEMAFLGAELAHKVTVEDPNKVAELCEVVPPVPKGRFFPEMPGADESIRDRSYARAKQLYGEPLPELVEARLKRELDAVISNKFGVLYEIARLLVAKSNEKGYSVGSRGSVGSSFAAFCLHITEVNPLPAHERCPQCRWVEFQPMQRLAGVDLPARPCPKCGQPLIRDGYDIPFESFVGFKGDKVPDIDLNFAPEVQSEVQKYAETLFGKGLAYKAGTISTIADKQAYGFVMKYFDAKGGHPRKAEIERLKSGLEGVKRTSGQHPGGVVLVRADKDINDVTPVQFSGDLNEMGGSEKANEESLMTTHFDYHAYDETLVKLDILGKDDGSAFRHLQEMCGVLETSVPLDDPQALSLFSSQKAMEIPKLSAEEKDWLGETGAVALPEFGTANTRRMLELTRPKNFTELIYISGLSHGTGVWANNAEKLIQDKIASLETVISTRDDIMTRLIRQGLDAALAFEITEAIRKGKVAKDGFKPEHEAALKAAKLPAWWVESCRKIQYMFPKAHATAYCFTAARLAWFKVHKPAAFYAAWLTLHAEAVDAAVLASGKAGILGRLRQLKERREARGDESLPKWTAKDEGSMNALVVALEASLRGVQFTPCDLYRSHPTRFMPLEEGKLALLMPLVCLPGLGQTAAQNIERERVLGAFTSIEELVDRCGINKTVVEKLKQAGALDALPASNQITLF